MRSWALRFSCIIAFLTATAAQAQSFTRLDLTVSKTTLATGESQASGCTARNASGTTVTIAKQWSSSDTAVAISSAGMVTGHSPGTAWITCEAGTGVGARRISIQLRDTARASAPPPPPPPPTCTVNSVTVLPASLALTVGATSQLTASANCATTFRWGAQDSLTVARISQTGLVTAIGVGSTIAAAASANNVISNIVAITVTAAQPPPPPPPSTVVASVGVTSAVTSLSVGQATQATATARDAGGTLIPGVVFAWSSSAPTVASVSSAGAVTGASAGSATIRATSPNNVQGSLAFTVTAVAPPPPPPPPAPTGTPDPTRLPVATLNMAMNTAAYSALNVRALAAGGSYNDPVTAVHITKLTSASFPASGSWGLPYFEGGTIISYPIDSTGRRSLLAFGGGGAEMIFDWQPGVGVSRARSFPSGGSPQSDLCFAFSTNPATPYYAYALTGSQLVRIDTRTMTLAPGNGFPASASFASSGGGWLQNSANDAAFVWMTGGTTYYFEPGATPVRKQYSNAAANEPRFSRSGRYAGLAMDSPQNGLTMVDFGVTPPVATWTANGSLPFAHNATLQGMWIGSDWNQGPYPFKITSVTSTPNSFKVEPGPPSVGALPVGNGAWLQSGDQRNAWTVWNSYSGLNGCGDFCNVAWTAPGGIVLFTANGERRLLAHPYSNQGVYFGSAWPQFSSDGRVVVFASDMLGAGRYDMFVIEMPLR